MTDKAHEYRCPLAVVDRRLVQVHQHWHEAEAEASYFKSYGSSRDPERDSNPAPGHIHPVEPETLVQ